MAVRQKSPSRLPPTHRSWLIAIVGVWGRDLQIAAGPVWAYIAKLRSSRADARDDDATRAALGGFGKRAVDVTIAGTALFLLAPIMVATALLIRLLIGKPVIFAQELSGLGGSAFTCYNFARHSSLSRQAVVGRPMRGER